MEKACCVTPAESGLRSLRRWNENHGRRGKLSDYLIGLWGLRNGYRALPLASLPISGVMLLVGVESSNPYWAVAALSLAFSSVERTEGAFFPAPTAVARKHSMAAWGVVNTGGNLGGILGTPRVAALSAHHAWTAIAETMTERHGCPRYCVRAPKASSLLRLGRFRKS